MNLCTLSYRYDCDLSHEARWGISHLWHQVGAPKSFRFCIILDFGFLDTQCVFFISLGNEDVIQLSEMVK
jgi:hypothetical protein